MGGTESKPFQRFTGKTVETVRKMMGDSITALKCGVNERLNGKTRNKRLRLES
jgi:hypothetical protein